jgi:hypothetical protein
LLFSSFRFQLMHAPVCDRDLNLQLSFSYEYSNTCGWLVSRLIRHWFCGWYIGVVYWNACWTLALIWSISVWCVSLLSGFNYYTNLLAVVWIDCEFNRC